MIYFLQIAQIGYLFTLLVFWSFIFLMEKTGTFFLQQEMIYIYGILLLPLLSFIYDAIFEDKNWRFLFLRKNSVLHILYFVSFLVFLWILGIKSMLIFLTCTLIFHIYMRWDARIFFALALFCLSGVVYYLLVSQSIQAEQLSIYVYYFLVAGVIAEIAGWTISKK